MRPGADVGVVGVGANDLDLADTDLAVVIDEQEFIRAPHDASRYPDDVIDLAALYRGRDERADGQRFAFSVETVRVLDFRDCVGHATVFVHDPFAAYDACLPFVALAAPDGGQRHRRAGSPAPVDYVAGIGNLDERQVQVGQRQPYLGVLRRENDAQPRAGRDEVAEVDVLGADDAVIR